MKQTRLADAFDSSIARNDYIVCQRRLSWHPRSQQYYGQERLEATRHWKSQMNEEASGKRARDRL
jgi:hypothetical protein